MVTVWMVIASALIVCGLLATVMSMEQTLSENAGDD